jgi:hypothetical protein
MVSYKTNKIKPVRWHTPIIPELRRLRQENHQFQDSLGYTVLFSSTSNYDY